MGADQSHFDEEHKNFTAQVTAFLPTKNEEIKGAEEEKHFSELAIQVVHHLVFNSKKLLNSSNLPEKEVKQYTTEIIACSRFLCKFAPHLSHQQKLFTKVKATPEEEARLMHIAFFEAGELAATALFSHNHIEEAASVLKASAVAQKRFFGESTDHPEIAAWLMKNGGMAAKFGDKELGATLQEKGVHMEYRMKKAEGRLLDEHLALELNVIGKKCAALGRFREAVELEAAGLEIRRAILANKQAMYTAVESSDDAAQKKAAFEDLTEARYHLAYSLHDAGQTVVKVGIEVEGGVRLLRESAALRKEVAAAEGGSNSRHKVDDLAKGLKDLGLALQQVEGENSEEARKVLHEAHLLYEDIIDKERVGKQ